MSNRRLARMQLVTCEVMTLLIIGFKQLDEDDDGADRESFMTSGICRDVTLLVRFARPEVLRWGGQEGEFCNGERGEEIKSFRKYKKWYWWFLS